MVVGVSPGTSIKGSYTFDGGQVVLGSDEFAASVLAAHTAAMKDGENDTPMDIEIGDKTFTIGTHRSRARITSHMAL
jgi:hypothetical protein